MKILILGAGGMLGHDMVTSFRQNEIISAYTPEWDITKKDILEKKIIQQSPDLIINCAAYTDVEGAEDNKDLAFKVNAEGTLNLAKICQKNKIVLLHLSTEYVFAGIKKEGYNEEDPTHALNIYGSSKEEGEKYLMANCEKFYLVRSSWLYGKASQKGKPRGKNFIEKIIELAQLKTQVKVVNDQFGKPTFTKDLAQAVKALIEEKPAYGIYHLINEGTASWYDFAGEIFKIKNIKTDLLPISSTDYNSKVIRPKFAVLNNNKRPLLRHWQEALKEYLT
ncbi:dTDP-4-dehydrorhamnose reductase [Patescibacteria group bacterium]|nr:dTDP-4-dehydrorhamnose reductase [Patescibacteria group bacterium]